MNSWHLDFSYQVPASQSGTAPFALQITCDWQAWRTGVFGPSGSGKSSLLEVLVGLRSRKHVQGIARQGAHKLFDSADALWCSPRDRHLGWVPQSGCLFPHLNVEQNIMFASAHRLAAQQVQALGLTSLLKKQPYELSGGERQRVALARALAADCRALLLDEPLSSLDKTARSQLLSIIQQTTECFKKPLLFVSHDWNEIMALCDHVLMIENGCLVESRSL